MIRKLVGEDPSVRILAVSGADDRLNMMKMAEEFGAAAAIQKPVSRRQLVDAVRRQCETATRPHEAFAALS
jgi:FixJ family two-component response regulator